MLVVPVSLLSVTPHKEITLAHFCQINEDNIVTQVIVVSDDDCAGGQFPQSEFAGAYFCNRLLGGTWKQTSYNGNFRGRYAGIGFTYDPELDEFIAPVVEEKE